LLLTEANYFGRLSPEIASIILLMTVLTLTYFFL
jgi:hypothetical protein